MNNQPTPTPMTAEEFISNNYSYSKEPLAWRLFNVFGLGEVAEPKPNRITKL